MEVVHGKTRKAVIDGEADHMKIGIISDTHDHHTNVLAAVELFNKLAVDYVLHAGDIVSPFTAKAFRKIAGAKFIAVYGNNDGEKLLLKQVIGEFGGEIHENCFKGQIARKKIFMTHTHYFIEEVVASGEYDLVVYGHTHKQDIRWVNGTMVVNPGEATDWLTGTPRVLILDLDTMEHEVIPLA